MLLDFVISFDHVGSLFAELHDEVDGFFIEFVGKVPALFSVFKSTKSIFEFLVGKNCIVCVGDDSFEFLQPSSECVCGRLSNYAVGIAEFIENFLLAQFFGFVGFRVGVAEYVVACDFFVESLPSAETGI